MKGVFGLSIPGMRYFKRVTKCVCLHFELWFLQERPCCSGALDPNHNRDPCLIVARVSRN